MSCSFCNSYSHNIRGCQDPMICLIYERMKVIYIDMMNQYPHDTEIRFNSVLNRRFNLRELRAICATHTNFPSSRPKQQIIYALYQYFSSRIYSLPRQEEEQPWLENRRLPTQPDPVPEFARDLEQPLEEDHDITWYIDTTPSTVSVLTFALIHDRLTSPRRLSYGQMRELTGGDQIRARDFVGTNLMSQFDADSGNIPFAPQLKKYNIQPLLERDFKEGVEECAICYESVNYMDFVELNCDHKFCCTCITSTLNAHNKLYGSPSCALCRKKMESFTVKHQEIYHLVSKYCSL